MSVIGVDLGGTKVAAAIIDKNGDFQVKQVIPIEEREGSEVASLITDLVEQLHKSAVEKNINIEGIGVSVPGIYYSQRGTVWAPNIKGWTDYPLLSELKSLPSINDIKIKIDSDRACYILGETWQGNAQGCKNAIFVAVGTGIGAGILIDGRVLRGQGDIAGAIGWLALDRPYKKGYKSYGCFEYHASGDGIARTGNDYLQESPDYDGPLKEKSGAQLSSYDIFKAYETKDIIAIKTIDRAISLWGMAAANLVSLFDPEVIVFGGGMFGPAAQFIDRIKIEAEKWAQPISIKQVRIDTSSIGTEAGLLGAGRLAFINE